MKQAQWKSASLENRNQFSEVHSENPYLSQELRLAFLFITLLSFKNIPF